MASERFCPSHAKADVSKNCHEESPIMKAATTISMICILLAFLMASDLQADNGLQILQQAESTIGSGSHSIEYDYTYGDSTTTVKLLQRQSNGQYEFVKTLIVNVQGILLTNVYLSIAGGYWQLLPDRVLRLDYMTIDKQSPLFGLSGHSIQLYNDADYDTRTAQVGGRKLIVVTQTPGTLADGLLSQRAQIIQEKFFLGADDHVIYALESKRRDGAVARVNVTQFTVLNNIPSSTFTLPAGLPEIVCSNVSQYVQNMNIEMQAMVQTPKFRNVARHIQQVNKTRHYVILFILLVPTVIFMWCLLRSRVKRRKNCNKP